MQGKGNDAIIEALIEAGALLKREQYPHKYPYDWRTKKPTIFRATDQVQCPMALPTANFLFAECLPFSFCLLPFMLPVACLVPVATTYIFPCAAELQET